MSENENQRLTIVEQDVKHILEAVTITNGSIKEMNTKLDSHIKDQYNFEQRLRKEFAPVDTHRHVIQLEQDVKAAHDSIDLEFDDLEEKFDKRYSGIWVQKMARRASYISLAIVVTYFINFLYGLI